jgi:membrane peptidoglycan carboxypeptidase
VIGADGPTGYRPANEDDVSYGPITVTRAMDKSVNAVYAQMAQDVGPAKVKATAIALGLPSDTPSLTTNPSMALGTATASPLDMASAYATLANHGRYIPYTLVVKVTKDGTDVHLPSRPAQQAISREAADTTTSILRSVVNGGTATAAQAAGRPSAGKTGTMEEDKAAWFAGYTPSLATVVAVMGQDSVTGKQKSLYGATGLPRVNGGGYPTQIWAAYTKGALKGTKTQSFELFLEKGASAPPVTLAPRTSAPATSRPPVTSAPPTTQAPTTTAPTTEAPTTEAPTPTTEAPTDGVTDGPIDFGTPEVGTEP